MKQLLVCALFFCLACSRGHDLNKYENIYFLKDVDAQVNKFEPMDWHVGVNEERIVSKGIILNLDLIELSTQTKETLSKEFRVDSWLYRFYRITKEGRKDYIGWVSISFDRISRSFQDFSVLIYYASAAVSRQFRSFKCPAFSHRKKLEDIEIKDFGKSIDKLFIARTDTVTADINNGQYFPITFNGGKELEGDYFVEAALYSSSLRITYSKWFQLQNVLQINKEIEVSLPSCLGIKEEDKPLPESRLRDIRDLEIK